MTRTLSTLLVVASLIIMAVGAGPAAAATNDLSSGFGDPASGPASLLNPVPGDATLSGPDALPIVAVDFEDGKLANVEDWTNQSDDYTLLDSHNGSSTAYVRAPPRAIGVGVWGLVQQNNPLAGTTTLQQASWVQDWSYVRSISLVEPVTEPANASDVGTPTISPFGVRDPSFPSAGIAYDDTTEAATLADARNVTGANATTASADGITIANIDSGTNVDPNGELGIMDNVDDASKDFIEDETVAEDGYEAVADPNGHGTWVSSAMVADPNTTVDGETYEGVAPDANLLVLRALDKDGSGSTKDIAQAIRYAADHDADVLQMSLGSPVYTEDVARALDYAKEQNVTIAAVAAGNSRQTTRWLASPSDTPLDNVVSVAATNTTDHEQAGVAYFSQLGDDPGTTDRSGGVTAGEQIDVSAPGFKVTAEVVTTDGTITTEQLSGTSMATPLVSAALAQKLGANETYIGNGTDLRDLLQDTARPMPNAAVAEAGQGMLAVDTLISETAQSEQTDAMDTPATTRQDFWETASDTSGGIFARLLS